jgi:hypothetical protein
MFGEMEQHSLHGGAAMVPARWSKKWQTCLRKTTFPEKGTSKEYPTENHPFFPFFTYFYYFLYFAALWSPRDHTLASPPRA